MSALRSVRYEAAPDVNWVGDDDDGSEEEGGMDLDSSEEEEEEVEEVEEGEEQEEVDGDEDEFDEEEEEAENNRHQTRNRWDRSHGQNGYGHGHGRRDKQEQARLPKAQALPIAELPDDYDGQVLDGATYLAISARVNATLPNYTRMSAPPSDTRPSGRIVQSQPEASSSRPRHPALPNVSWTTVFPTRFKNYRARIKAEWPPDLPYPSHLPPRPRSNIRGEVWQYIRGCRRKLIDPDEVKDKGKGKGKGKETAPNGVEEEDDEEAAMNGSVSQLAGGGGGGGAGEQDMELEPEEDGDDEEEAMNTAPRPKVLEEEAERHKSHEPLVSALQGYTSVELVCLIELITTFISETLDLLSPFVMIPNDAETPNNPFPDIYMRWLFACLLLLDDHLDGQSMSSIRDLARTVMKVAGWRWIRAVTDKEISADEGAEWKYGDTATSAAGLGEVGLEATLGRCWIIVHAVASGWAQRDLLDDLENMFKT